MTSQLGGRFIIKKMSERDSAAAEEQVDEQVEAKSAAGNWPYELPDTSANRGLLQRVTGKALDGRLFYHCGKGCCGPKKKHQLKCPNEDGQNLKSKCEGFFKCAFCHRCKYFVVFLIVSHRIPLNSPEGRPRAGGLPRLRSLSLGHQR